jgi:beta-N-acetylhexosaminidase
VTVNNSLATLRADDEAPYRAAIPAGVKVVMTSWAVYPALDRRLPASLSRAVIQGELRSRLGFRGVTITDGIDAGAATSFGDVGTRSVRAAAAGADLILGDSADRHRDGSSEGTAVLHALATAIARGQISRASARRSVTRILALRVRP